MMFKKSSVLICPHKKKHIPNMKRIKKQPKLLLPTAISLKKGRKKNHTSKIWQKYKQLLFQKKLLYQFLYVA